MTTQGEASAPRRRSIRLPTYDYAQPGAYFITICTKNWACLFGNIADGEMRLSEAGRVVEATWHNLPRYYSGIELDAFVVMPNHIHGIILIVGPEPESSAKPPGLPEIVRGFKTFSARRLNEMQGTQGRPLWHRNYYEHIIRNEDALNRIREYIANNPLQWESDPENTTRKVHSRQPEEPWRK